MNRPKKNQRAARRNRPRPPENGPIATLWNQGSGGFGVPRVYFSTSTDFIRWTKPALAMTLDQMLRQEPEGNCSYGYFSLIDPKASDLSYATITDHPYLYYVRMDDVLISGFCFGSESSWTG